MPDIDDVLKAVKRDIIPDRKLSSAVRSKAETIRDAVDRECMAAGLVAEVRIDGSVAKDTWLRDNADADIFMRVSPDLSKTQLRDICLPIAKRALSPNRIVERFAEHPYVESKVTLGRGPHRFLRVNVVPCYRVEPGRWLSATDRSPYHTEYVRQHMSVQQRGEVRLLKSFMKGIGAYGADIKTGGFSGMLCETLIMANGSFLKAVKDFSNWRESRFIDIENYHQGRNAEVHRLFREPLIVIDPVDKDRNLAAAVRRNQLWNFVAASRQLLENPSTSYFREPKARPITVATYRRLTRIRGTALLAVLMGRMDVVVDVLWSQLYKTERALVNLLQGSGFSIIRSQTWSDERSISIILVELEQAIQPNSRIQLGPPISRVPESASFLAKHMRDRRTVAGPWIAGDRWSVQKERPFPSAVDLLRESLRSGGREIGVASEPERIFRKRVEVRSGKGIEGLIRRNREFAKAVKVFLAGRPSWLG